VAKVIVNLTFPVVVEKIEQVLETYPDHPYQQIFANPDTRQELIAYVLTRVQSVFMVVDEMEQALINAETLPHPEAAKLCMGALVHQGIRDILNQYGAEIDHQIPEDDSCLVASHWFG
jgi:hypothetical protein